MKVEVAVPDSLRQPIEAALTWINANEQRNYELTGLVGCEGALDMVESADRVSSYELGLVLCDGEICAHQQIRVQPDGESYRFALVTAGRRDIPSLLDPPEGIRSGWLASVLDKNEFVLLLFYRGLW